MPDVQLQALPTEATPADAHVVAGDNGTVTSKFTLSSLKAYIAASLGLTGTPTAPTAGAGTNTTQVATTAHVFAERSNAATLTNKTLTSPTVNTPSITSPSTSGVETMDGAQVQTSAAMGALAVDVTKIVNTKTISVDSTLTFSATPATDTWFSLLLTNSDTNPHTITIPSSYSMALQAAITSFVIGASSRVLLTWRRNASGYELFGDTNYLNNYAATANPAVTDDISKGYGPGSLWLNATSNNLYICETNGAGAAVWNLVTGGGSGITQLTSDVTAGPGSGSQAATIAPNAVTYAKMQDVSATARIIGRKTAAAGDPEECTLSEILDFIGSAARGDILYRGASAWARLAAGTAGQVLTTQGAGADPSWAAGGGGASLNGLARPMPFVFARAGSTTPQYSDGLPWQPQGAAPTSASIMGGAIYLPCLAYAASSAGTDTPYGIGPDGSGHVVMPNGGENSVLVIQGIWSPNSATSTLRIGAGVTSQLGGALTGDPSAQVSCIMLAGDAADTNLQIMHNDGSGTCTKIDLGANFPKVAADTKTYYYRFDITSPTSVAYYVKEMVTNPGSPATGTLSTNLPPAGTVLGLRITGNTGTVSATGGIKNYGTWSEMRFPSVG